MLFFLAALIIAIACSAITIKTLVGYSSMRFVYKIVISVMIVLGWFAVSVIHVLETFDFGNNVVFGITFNLLYGLMGFVFILFIFIMLRDVVWYAIYGIAKLLKIEGWHIHPKNISLLDKANMIVVIVSILVSGYAFYQGYKMPKVKEVFTN